MAVHSKFPRILALICGVLLVIGAIILLFIMTSPHAAEAPEEVSAREPIEIDPVGGLYTGVMACEDCAGIETALTITTDGSDMIGRYTLSETYLGTDAAPVVRAGEWVVDEYSGTDYAGDVYILYDTEGNETGQAYLAMNSDTLVLLDIDGTLIESDIPQELTRR